jgi:hypothetical protein
VREAVLGQSVCPQETGDLHTLAATLLNVGKIIFSRKIGKFSFRRNPRKSSSTAFRFLIGFPLFEKSGKIYLWRQIYERSLSELRISASDHVILAI